MRELPREGVAAPSLESFKVDWIGLGATWCSGKCPCPGQRLEQDDF